MNSSSDAPSKHPTQARLIVLLSKDPTRSLVLRRGPGKKVVAFLWDRTANTFELGQWLKGKVYWERADISPDGRHWLYLALDKHGETHMVLARVPYFTALDYYDWGHTWHGGGVFQSNSSYILSGEGLQSKEKNGRRDSGFDVKSEAVHVMPTRLLRLGWSRVAADHRYFEKPLCGDWTLQVDTKPSRSLGRGYSTLSHSLINALSGFTYERSDWEWADVLGEHVYWAEGGCLWRASLVKDQCYGEPEQLHDFNPYTFEAKPAPY